MRDCKLLSGVVHLIRGIYQKFSTPTLYEDPVEYKDSVLASGGALEIIRGSICVLSRGKRLDIKIYAG